MHTTVLVVGAGLSGLLTAHWLTSNGVSVRIVEARPSLGGRILSHPFQGGEAAAVDMGPSWFWPGQPGMQSLIDELGLRAFVYEQYSQGLSVMEYASGEIQHSKGGASMAGSCRLKGGMGKLIDSLASSLDADHIHVSANVIGICDHQDGLVTSVSLQGSVQSIKSDFVVLALPPRVVASSIRFEPDLPAAYQQALEQTPTWMAAQAKCVAIYSSAFWRSRNFSGDGFSQLGPLTEIHDASTDDERHAALFGFVGVPEHVRRGQQAAVKQAVVEQLVRMFGEPARTPLAVHLKDWAGDPQTCTALDLQPATRAAPGFDLTQWGGKLVWAGSETASHSLHANGYLEGAVETANRACKNVLHSMSDIG